jgi:hypothetical protein
MGEERRKGGIGEERKLKGSKERREERGEVVQTKAEEKEGMEL